MERRLDFSTPEWTHSGSRHRRGGPPTVHLPRALADREIRGEVRPRGKPGQTAARLAPCAADRLAATRTGTRSRVGAGTAFDRPGVFPGRWRRIRRGERELRAVHTSA